MEMMGYKVRYGLKLKGLRCKYWAEGGFGLWFG